MEKAIRIVCILLLMAISALSASIYHRIYYKPPIVKHIVNVDISCDNFDTTFNDVGEKDFFTYNA